MSTPEVNAPYVVSADIAGLFKYWASQEGHTHPSDQHFRDYTLELQRELGHATNAVVEIVEEAELYEGLDMLMDRSVHQIVSLDRVYTNEHERIAGYIDTTRVVDEDLNDLGNAPRPGYPPLNHQIQALGTSQETPIVLVDDVIFTGGSVIKLAKQLQEVNRPVAKVMAGIAVRGGVQAIEEAFKDSPIEVEYVRIYEEVVDQVCERDFIAGVPFSGRTILSSTGDQHWSAPYFEPFGRPEEWAGIPAESVGRFSRFCIEQSILLWSETEKATGQEIAAHSIPRKLRALEGEESVAAGLQRHLQDPHHIKVS